MTIYCDGRWQGRHGIGRFAAKVLGTDLQTAKLIGSPVSPLDPIVVSAALLRLPSDSVFFSPGYNPPLMSRVPFVFTIHDLNHIDRPENSSTAKRLYYSLVLRPACQRAAYVLTVSEFSRRRILEWSGVSAEKVVNVGNGVDASYRPDVKGFDTGYPYLLCVSNRKRHKNELRTVEAFARATVPSQMRLVFTGNPTEQLCVHIAGCGATGRVQFVGHVSDADLPSLYKGATALVFPSLYEGFGLPVIEAMACGTPVITSNTTSLPEVAGDAALLVHPESLQEISAAISRVIEDESLRGRMRHRGLIQARRFTWENTAQRVRKILESISTRNLARVFASI